MNDVSNRCRARRHGKIALTLAAAITAVTLLQVLGNSLVWDDQYLITNGEGLGEPGALWDYLSKPFWQNNEFVARKLLDYWRPLTSLMLWFTAFVFGKWPPAFHGLSILVALGAAAALYLLARTAYPRGGRMPAAGIALLFLAHPLAAEVVCMAANISDHLVFAFLAMALVLLARRLSGAATGPTACIAAGALVFLACASKELGVIGVAAPLGAWLIARAGGSNVPFMRLADIGPWLAALAAVGLFLFLRHTVTSQALGHPTQLPSLSLYGQAVFIGLGHAALRIFAPAPSGANVYIQASDTWAIAIAALSWIGLIAVISYSALRGRTLGIPIVGLLFALALLLPSLLAVGSQYDDALRFPTRYFHLPLAGVLLALLPSIDQLWQRIVRFVLPVAIILLALLSFVRIGEWTDSISFFAAEADYHPDSPPDLLNLARAMKNAGAFTEAEAVIKRIEALPYAQSDWFQAELDNDRAAIALYRDGDAEAASEILRRSLARWPYDLANVLDLATARAVAGRPEQSVEILKRALDAPWFQDYRRPAIERRIELLKKLAANDDKGKANGR